MINFKMILNDYDVKDFIESHNVQIDTLKDELNEQEFKIVNKYIKKMYKKFLKPIELQEQEQGFYQMANGGMSILVYASWTNNKKLAAKEINHRFKEMDRLFYEDGYINNNSFRGARSQWYHSYGLDIALGYVYIANLWGAEVPEKLSNKLVKASELANLAITDYEAFRSRPFGEKNTNITEDPKLAKKHTHQMAIAIDTLMKIVTAVELEHDAVYLQKRKYHTKDGIDDLIGFNPNCIHEELIKQEAKKLIESKSDPDNGTLNVGTYETNEDPEKRKRIIKTLINKITKNIMKKSNSSKNDIENWVRTEIEKLNWDKDLDKGSDRKKLRDKLTKKGIKKFK